MLIIEWIVFIVAIIVALLAFLSIDYIHRDLFYMRFKTRSYSMALLVVIILIHELDYSKLHLIWIVPFLYSLMHIIAERIVKPLRERRR
jgi:hypothetical protein